MKGTFVDTYRRSVTPGSAVSTRSQQRLRDLRCDPLGRLVLQLSEVDIELQSLAGTNYRMVRATLLALKFSILKELLPYAYSKIPQEDARNSNPMTPIVINVDGQAQSIKPELVNAALQESREAFPEYE